MKYLMWLFFAVLLVSSCKTTQEVEETGLSSEYKPIPEPQTRSAVRGSLTGEQLAAQLGLEGATEEEFIQMFDATTAAMQQVRVDHRGDTQSLIREMQAVKAERVESVERILNPEQLKQYYIIMQENRGKVRGSLHQRRG